MPLYPRAELHAADGTHLVLLSNSSLDVGKASAPSFRMGAIRREHVIFGFHDGTLAVSAHGPGCSVSRAGGATVLLQIGSAPLILSGGDTVFLQPGMGLVVHFVFSASAPVHIPGLPPPPSYPELSMRLASAERDNERLRTEIAQLHSELGRYDDIILGAIAPRSDALHRQCTLADGIICGC